MIGVSRPKIDRKSSGPGGGSFFRAVWVHCSAGKISPGTGTPNSRSIWRRGRSNGLLAGTAFSRKTDGQVSAYPTQLVLDNPSSTRFKISHHPGQFHKPENVTPQRAISDPHITHHRRNAQAAIHTQPIIETTRKQRSTHNPSLTRTKILRRW